MSKMIQIRNVPDELHRTLKVRAAKVGMTLSDYLFSEIEQIAEKPTMNEWLERVTELEPLDVDEPPELTIRRMRDAGDPRAVEKGLLIVVDASAAVTMFLNLGPNAGRVRDRLRQAEEVHIPHLFDVEVLHVLRRYSLRGDLSGRPVRETEPAHLEPPPRDESGSSSARSARRASGRCEKT